MKKFMIKLNIVLIISVVITALIPRTAFSADEGQTTLRSLVDETLNNSPRIREAKFNWLAAIEKIPQTGSLPDPMLSLTYFPEPIETRLGPNEAKLMLSQKIPYLKKLDVKEDIAGKEVVIAYLEFNMEIKDVVTSLMESYFELLYIDKAIYLTAENKKVLDELAKIAATGYASDIGTLNDLLSAQSELAQLNYDVMLLEELKETETAKIASILNRPAGSRLGELENVMADFKFTVDEMYGLYKANQEELKIIDAKIKKLESVEELSRLSSYPDFKIDLMYSEIGEPDGMQPDDAGRDSYGITFGMTLPVWRDKNRASVIEKGLNKRAAMERKNAHMNDTDSKIKNLYFRLNNAKRLMELYKKTLIPQAETTMQKAEEWYRQKNSGFSELLETQSVIFNFRLSYQRALADYNKYAVKLYRLIGVEFSYTKADSAGGK